MATKDAKDIIKQAQNKNEKTKTSIYVDNDLWNEFLKKCEQQGVKSSKVIEILIRRFLEELK